MKHLNICCSIPICLKIVHISFIKISAEKLTAYYIQICLSLMGIVLEAVTVKSKAVPLHNIGGAWG
jgi:hypothetical protein